MTVHNIKKRVYTHIHIKKSSYSKGKNSILIILSLQFHLNVPFLNFKISDMHYE